ncbi:MAG: hypothetical protein ABFR75_12175 [Acidobacteriota bacterium]
MDFLTKIATKLMPVIHHPLFKIGCYSIAAITVLTLIYLIKTNRKKEKEAFKKKEIKDVNHPLTTTVSLIFFISLTVGLLADITEWNEPFKIKFSDSGNEEKDCKFTMSLPDNMKDLKKIQKKFKSQEKFFSKGARPIVTKAIKLGTELLKNEKCTKEKEKKLRLYIEDQLENGFYIVKKGKVIRDENGVIIREPHTFVELRVKFENIKLENLKKEKTNKE